MAKKYWLRIGITTTVFAIVVTVAAFYLQTPDTPVAEPSGTSAPDGTSPPNPIPKNNTPNTPEEETDAKTEQEVANDNAKPNEETAAVPDDKPEDEDTIITSDGRRYPMRTYEPLATPNDPGAGQWWEDASGLTAAWDYPAGPHETLVAVVDTGFALEHEELQGRWHDNEAEQGATSEEAPSNLNCSDQGIALDRACNNIDDDFDGIVDNESGSTALENPSDLNCTDQDIPLDKACNNIDDDGNGLADDVRGWDFSNFDSSVQTGQTNPSGDGTQHGTMVSGILGATGNNGTGIAGVNWHTTILPIQVLDDDSYGNTLTVARGVRYAAQQGADIISVSIGAQAEDPYLREAVQYALERGSLVVASSGNDGCDCITYPARYPEVLATGASDQQGDPANFSSYGANLDLLAPGVSMTAPSWSEDYPTDGYATGSGTSFATPYVSGLLALARSHQPDANWGELTAALREEADHGTLTADSPHSSTLGFGHARADSLLERATTPIVSEWRYQFGPLEPTDTLATARSYQCKNGRQPTTPLYTLRNSGKIRYTTSDLAKHKAEQNGWSGQRLTYTCTGLPGDDISTLRVINLINEIHNKPFQKL